MKAFRLALLASAVLLAPTSLAFSQECAKEPVAVGFLPKLDTDPYFKVAFGGAEEAGANRRGAVPRGGRGSAGRPGSQEVDRLLGVILFHSETRRFGGVRQIQRRQIGQPGHFLDFVEVELLDRIGWLMVARMPTAE